MSEIVWHPVDWDGEDFVSDPMPDAGPVLVTTAWGVVTTDVVVWEGDIRARFDFYNGSVKAWAVLPTPYSADA